MNIRIIYTKIPKYLNYQEVLFRGRKLNHTAINEK